MDSGLLASLNFVDWWKAISIVLTGFFGVLGLLTNFKDKNTGRITKWGKFSLAGILVSICMGVAAQLKEVTAQQKARDESALKTLQIVTATQTTLHNLERSLAPL